MLRLVPQGRYLAQDRRPDGDPVPNGVEGCADKYGCARPSFDSDFWEWVPSGEQDCADEHGCARPRLPGKGDATPVEKPEGPGKKIP